MFLIFILKLIFNLNTYPYSNYNSKELTNNANFFQKHFILLNMSCCKEDFIISVKSRIMNKNS